MNEFRLWLNEEIVKKRREHAALLRLPDTDEAGRRLNELYDEMLDLKTALRMHSRFERVKGALDETT